MTPAEKEEIYTLRLQGLGYKVIAKELLIGADAIKGYYKRYHLNKSVELIQSSEQAMNGLCPQCKNHPPKEARSH